MAVTKKRSSTAVIVPTIALQQATTTLQELPEKPKETWSLREAIALLQEPISTALSRGYGYEEITAILNAKGIKITASSLKRYLSITKPKAATAKPKTRRTRRSRPSDSSVSDEGEATSGTAAAKLPEQPSQMITEMDSAPAEASEQTVFSKRRSRASSKTTSDASADATKATKPRTTTRTKTSPRSTSTRRRKSSDS
ncbi:MAG: hypothetical protein HC769_05765 [Cyanobacteria bacterium CRU_2_1]|nr:hypothetical protein [Cyanobacteria bacterium RU_5_0]NJR58398.1 hypothetical protein [Cyanobacteria bacterium CRU_2_1]